MADIWSPYIYTWSDVLLKVKRCRSIRKLCMILYIKEFKIENNQNESSLLMITVGILHIGFWILKVCKHQSPQTFLNTSVFLKFNFSKRIHAIISILCVNRLSDFTLHIYNIFTGIWQLNGTNPRHIAVTFQRTIGRKNAML